MLKRHDIPLDNQIITTRPGILLPLELVENITAFLKRDTKALHTCTRINRTFCYCAVKLLWSSPNPSSVSAMKIFKQVITKSIPSLFNLIRGFISKTPVQKFEGNLSLIKEISLGGYEWTNSHPTLLFGGALSTGGIFSLFTY
jgi:hypothetical protein